MRTLWFSQPVPAPTLTEYLQQLQQQGVTHVEIDDSARQVLRELYTRGSAKRPNPTKSTSPAKTVTNTPPAALTATGNTPADKIASLAQTAKDWPATKALGTLRDTLVFSTGNAEADLMIIGEAPGYHEEQKQEPLVGPAGAKLDQILKAMGLSRQQVYLTNICKNRPATKNQTMNNRKPSPVEMESSLPFLKAEIDIVKPKAIIALGATAAQTLLNSDQKIDLLRNSWHQFQGIPLRVSYHPSYLLLEEGLTDKRKVWEDMLAAMEQLKLPISDKQRSFFT